MARRGSISSVGWGAALRCGALLAAAALSACSHLGPSPLAEPMPNQVAISTRLVTAGQPSRWQLRQLKERGFVAVVHIAVDGSANTVADEAQLVQAQALEYVRISIDAQGPTANDARDLALVLDRLATRRVLVHCEHNVLASSLVFLYRARAPGDEARRALTDLERVWVPQGRLRDFIKRHLRERGIDFEAI